MLSSNFETILLLLASSSSFLASCISPLPIHFPEEHTEGTQFPFSRTAQRTSQRTPPRGPASGKSNTPPLFDLCGASPAGIFASLSRVVQLLSYNTSTSTSMSYLSTHHKPSLRKSFPLHCSTMPRLKGSSVPHRHAGLTSERK